MDQHIVSALEQGKSDCSRTRSGSISLQNSKDATIQHRLVKPEPSTGKKTVSIFCKKNRTWALLISVLVFTFVLSSLVSSSVPTQPLGSAPGMSAIPRHLFAPALNHTSLDTGAFVFLALGAQANSLSCPAAVESLVKYGGWGGDVYMLTDRKSCFSEESIVNNAGMQREKFHLVTTDEDFGKMEYDFKHSNIGLRKNRVKSFSMKTRLFEFIENQDIKTIVYADCDILFTNPGCATDLITAGDKSWDKGKIKFLHFQREKVNGERLGHIFSLHAGTFVAHRDHSKYILKQWQQNIDSGRYAGDMWAFMDIYNRTGVAPSVSFPPGSAEEIASLFPGEHPPQELIVDPNGKALSSNWYEKFFNPLTAGHNCMTHIPKHRCSLYGRDAVQEFVNRLDLATFDHNRYKYCVNPTLVPLMYGWIPISYLPFCPKLEHYL